MFKIGSTALVITPQVTRYFWIVFVLLTFETLSKLFNHHTQKSTAVSIQYQGDAHCFFIRFKYICALRIFASGSNTQP